MRIAVVGARGQLAAAVAHEFAASGHDVIALTREELDVTDDAAIAAAMDRARPDAIVNGAAWTDVDGAEDHPVEALNTNAYAVRALARAADRHGAALVHYSTDFVFDGSGSAPYTEEDRPNPRSVYAATKLLGEWFALDQPRSYVLRVESLFGQAPGARPAKGSAAVILDTLRAGGAPKVFVDRTITPTFVLDAARATRQLLQSPAPAGLYHCVNSGVCTWLEFAQELAHQLGIEPRLVPVRLSDMPLRAPRPKYCALSNEKLRSIGIEMPPWQDAVTRYLSVLVGR
ncbi:MAG TPA: dTDP-4-dehydrorhamnose reductase [Vicinamibacterales bacterium]|nr:dTDP-4-dehydrorhamnose reductase [Vicinamibacterales bacterium]